MFTGSSTPGKSKERTGTRRSRPSLSPLVARAEDGKRGWRAPAWATPLRSGGGRARAGGGGAASEAARVRLGSVSTSAAAMLCIPSADLELLAALQQDMHASLAGELALERWECAHDAVQAAAATRAVTVVALGTRWARPCRVLFGTLARAVARYADVAAAGIPVALRTVDHEASAGVDLERVPIGVPATFVFVHGEPILFRVPDAAPPGTAAATAPAPKTPQQQAEHSETKEETEEEEDDYEEKDEEEEGGGEAQGNKSAQGAGDDQRVLRRCVMGALSAVQAEFLVERCVAAVAAAAAAKTATTTTTPQSRNTGSPAAAASLVVDLYEGLDSPFEEELQMRQRWRGHRRV